MMKLEPNFPAVLNNTIISLYKACPYQCWLKDFCNVQVNSENVHLTAGAAYANGLEAWRKARYFDNTTPDDALSIALCAVIKTYGHLNCSEWEKSWLAVCEAIVFYADSYPPESEAFRPFALSDIATLEFSMAMPLPFKHPDTGEPIMYVGRVDQFVKNVNDNMVYSEDDKTVSKLGATFSRRFKTDGQFLGYNYMAKYHYDIPVIGSLLRATCFYVNRLDKDQILISHSDTMLENWYNGLIQTVEQMLIMYLRKSADGPIRAFNTACSNYGGCVFQEHCYLNYPISRPEFKKQKWDPVNRVNIVIEED